MASDTSTTTTPTSTRRALVRHARDGGGGGTGAGAGRGGGGTTGVDGRASCVHAGDDRSCTSNDGATSRFGGSVAITGGGAGGCGAGSLSASQCRHISTGTSGLLQASQCKRSGSGSRSINSSATRRRPPPSWPISCSAAAISAASSNRPAASRASAFMATASSARGTSRLHRRRRHHVGAVDAPQGIEVARRREQAAPGQHLVQHTPAANTSTRRSNGRRLTCSGAAYASWPRASHRRVEHAARRRERWRRDRPASRRRRGTPLPSPATVGVRRCAAARRADRTSVRDASASHSSVAIPAATPTGSRRPVAATAPISCARLTPSRCSAPRTARRPRRRSRRHLARCRDGSAAR